MKYICFRLGVTATHNQTPHKQLNPSVTVWVVSVTCVFLISTKPGPLPSPRPAAILLVSYSSATIYQPNPFPAYLGQAAHQLGHRMGMIK